MSLSLSTAAGAALLLVSFSSMFGPCSKKDEGAEAGTDAATAAVEVDAAVPVVEPVAKNAAKIARFGSDTKLDMAKDKIQADFVNARESPGGGAAVATLKKDTEVTKIAQHGDYVLVAFADPKAAADTLEGWIAPSAFTPSPVSTVKVAGGKCAIKGQVFFANAACKFECSAAIACPTGFACTGVGSRPEVSAEPFSYCEAVGGVVDAGPPAPISCKGNLVLHTDNKCHLKCTTAKDCAATKGSVCTPVSGGVSACIP